MWGRVRRGGEAAAGLVAAVGARQRLSQCARYLHVLCWESSLDDHLATCPFLPAATGASPIVLDLGIRLGAPATKGGSTPVGGADSTAAEFEPPHAVPLLAVPLPQQRHAAIRPGGRGPSSNDASPWKGGVYGTPRQPGAYGGTWASFEGGLAVPDPAGSAQVCDR
jgi:hypothetical protein